MILCCGEALIDMLPREIPAEGPGFLPVAGGAVFNTAVALGRLGAPTAFFSGLSEDMFGDMLVAALDAADVDHSACARLQNPTTLAFVQIVDGNAQYAFFDENSAGRMLTEDHLPRLDENMRALVFGAISLIAEPCGSTYEALLTREHANRLVYLDPNIRPGFVTDVAAYRARLERMIAMSDIVKISDEDIAWLAANRASSDLISEWLNAGASIVLETRGASGAVAHRSNETVEQAGVATTVVDTVGAGDTFNAGFLAGLSEAGKLEKHAIADLDETILQSALALGVRAAAITVSRAGANPPWRNEIA